MTFKNMTFSIIMTLILASCAGPTLKQTPISLNEDPSQQLESMEDEIEQARVENIDTLSPNWFRKASKSYSKAKDLHSKGGRLKDIFENLSLAHAQLDRAKGLAPIAKMVLVPVTKERRKALKAGANERTEGFSEAEEEYLELSALIEKDKREDAEKKSQKLKAKFSAVELEAIKDQVLAPSRNRVKEAIGLGAKNVAPKTLSLAQKHIADVEIFIKKDRYNKVDIENKANAALFMADRATNITKEALKIQKDSPEKTALKIESITERIAANLSLPDIRNLDFPLQTNEIVKSISYVTGIRDQLQNKRVDLESDLNNLTRVHELQVAKLEDDKNLRLAKLKSELKKEEVLLSRLQKERKFTELLMAVEKEFSPREGEVYRQGNKLVFRLKGADFPFGKATIPSKNYPLLNKVTNSIKKFNNSRVTVEGHTDSIGKAELNKNLSMLRAKAVGDYLVAHGVATKSSIVTKGYGYKSPIATNKTPDGRKKNRRIDIIVELPKE